MVWAKLWSMLRRFRRPELSPATRIHRTKDRPFDRILHAAVVIKALEDRPEQRHVGLIYRHEFLKRLRFLHLGWHNQLTESDPDESYIWVESQIPKRRARQVAACARQIHRANGRFIPYGWSLPSDCFEPDTYKHLFGDGTEQTGLTCATFVLAVYDKAKLRLAHYNTWKARPDDTDWQRWAIDILIKDPKATAKRIEAIKNGLGSFRFRPEEVAAASAQWPPASTFESSKATAVAVLEKLGVN